MKVAVIDYNAGNVQSVLFALQRIGVEAILTNDANKIHSADKVIFPGVGEANSTMYFLKNNNIDEVIVNLRQPVLGICLGMQLLCDYSEEGDTNCLGIIPLKVKKFVPQKAEQKVPHMGWNTIQVSDSLLFDESHEKNHVYFVHSYYVEKGPFTIATCDYILPFSAAIQKDNFYATQFHPEKSGSVGESILKNFIAL